MYENPYQYLSGNIGDKKLIRAGFEEKLYDTGQVKLNSTVFSFMPRMETE